MTNEKVRQTEFLCGQKEPLYDFERVFTELLWTEPAKQQSYKCEYCLSLSIKFSTPDIAFLVFWLVHLALVLDYISSHLTWKCIAPAVAELKDAPNIQILKI